MKQLCPLAVVFLVLMAACSAHALREIHKQIILDKLDDYSQCQSQEPGSVRCQDALQGWVKDHPSDAFEAGRLSRRRMNGASALPFFTQAFAAGKTYCKDEDVKLAVLGGLEEEADGGPFVKQAKAIGFGKCFAEMREAIVQAASIGSLTFMNACGDLISRGAISGLKAKKCKGVAP